MGNEKKNYFMEKKQKKTSGKHSFYVKGKVRNKNRISENNVEIKLLYVVSGLTVLI